MRLNRTSVGLKQSVAQNAISHEQRPQSNQRGIETGDSVVFAKWRGGLNRTSVGLKRFSSARWFEDLQEASIEPAWD